MNIQIMKTKVELLLSYMKLRPNHGYIIVIDNEYIKKNKLTQNTGINIKDVEAFLSQFDKLSMDREEPRIFVWWLYACNEVWKQVKDYK